MFTDLIESRGSDLKGKKATNAGRIEFFSMGSKRHPSSLASIVDTISSTGWCSQNLRTCQPSLSQSVVVSASRAMFVSIFSSQNSLLVFGLVRCRGQPCQKHPSIRTARRLRGKVMSEVRRMVGTGRRLTKNRRPRRCSSRLTASSGRVSRLRLDRMLRRTLAEEAQETSCGTSRL